MDNVWVKNGLVWTGGENPAVFEGGVLCQGERIAAVGPDEALAQRSRGATPVDAQGRLIAPGFINAHMHL